MRRAISTAYYALFHTIAESAANFMIDPGDGELARDAWKAAYRALDHATLKRACGNQQLLRRQPEALREFADLLMDMQSRRHQADYDPLATFSSVEIDERSMPARQQSLRS